MAPSFDTPTAHAEAPQAAEEDSEAGFRSCTKERSQTIFDASARSHEAYRKVPPYPNLHLLSKQSVRDTHSRR